MHHDQMTHAVGAINLFATSGCLYSTRNLYVAAFSLLHQLSPIFQMDNYFIENYDSEKMCN